MDALIVDPDIRILDILDFHLTKLQFEVKTANSLITAVSMARQLKPQVILFGIDAAPGDAMQQCKMLRFASDDPIMVAVGRPESVELDANLRANVDHVLVGEFKIAPFLRDIRRIIWRRKGILCPAQASPMDCGPFVIAPSQGMVYAGNRSIAVSPHEADLMYCLAKRAPEAVSRETLLNLVWGATPRGESDRRVEVCVHSIRQKIEPDPAHPTYLVLRRSVGYVLKTDEAG